MNDFLKSVIKSKTFKVIIGAIAAALTAYASTGCASLLAKAQSPAAQRALAVLECKIEVLAPYVGPLAANVVQSIDGDRAFSPVQFLAAQGLTPAEALEVAKAYLACSGPAEPEPAEPDAGYQTL